MRPWLALALIVCAAPATSAQDASQRVPVRSIRAMQVAEAVTVDGVLDEQAWTRAEVARDFVQQQPQEGSLATHASEVRVLYDADALYIGGTFYDDEPSRAISNELKRDFSARDGDLITVVIDTFHDRKNAFNFMINPAGALRDSQSHDDGRQNNANWDGVWSVKTAFFDDRWTMEMWIPFRTLRFDRAEEQTWGFNVFRLVRRKNEISLWSPVPRQFGQFKTSYAGVLNGIRGVNPGRNVQVKPYLVGESRTGARTDGDWGGDVKIGVASSATLDLTYKTDFAQVEQDEQQINLTRFSLFLPEKREFFLENQGVFRMGDIDQSTGVRSPIIPFFSRRIGLSEAGRPVPILGGGRFSGHFDRWGVGFLNLQTNKVSDDNYSAMRVVRQTDRFGSYSAFYFGRETGAAEGFSRVIGGDMHLSPRRTLDVDLFVMRSSSASLGEGSAGRGSINLLERGYTGHLSFTHIGETFRNDLGFVPRGNINLFSWQGQRHMRPERTRRVVLTYTAGVEGDVYWRADTRELETRTAKGLGRVEFADGSILEAAIAPTHERLLKGFVVAGLPIGPGAYDFTQTILTYTSDKSRMLSGNVGWTRGGYWSGDIATVDLGVRARMSKHLALSATGSRSALDLPTGSSDVSLLRLRADASFSTRMFLNAFAQYASNTRTWTSNVRFRFTYKPLSDLFIVYSSLDQDQLRPVRSLAIKSTLLMSF